MQIDKIQAAQPCFGTKIKTDIRTLNNISQSSNIKKYFTKFVKELENNGRNDVFVLTQGVGDWGYNCNAFVYELKTTGEKDGQNLYRDSHALSFQMSGFFSDAKDLYEKEVVARIKEAYDACYEKMSKREFKNVCTDENWTKNLI